MLLTILSPNIMPQFASYVTLSSTMTVNIGFLLGDVNTTLAYDNRRYTLADATGAIVQTGIVSVQLNTYATSLTFYGLRPNTFYTLRVYNDSMVGEAVIATGRIVGVLDELSQLSTNAAVFVTNKLTVVDESAPTSYRRLTLKPSTTFADVGTQLASGVYIGQSLASIDGSLYAFRPSRLLTYNRSMPAIVKYIPFATLTSADIDVIQLARITKVGIMKYSVSPPTRIRVVVGNDTIDFDPPTSVIDLSDKGIQPGTPVTVRQLF